MAKHNRAKMEESRVSVYCYITSCMSCTCCFRLSSPVTCHLLLFSFMLFHGTVEPNLTYISFSHFNFLSTYFYASNHRLLKRRCSNIRHYHTAVTPLSFCDVNFHLIPAQIIFLYYAGTCTLHCSTTVSLIHEKTILNKLLKCFNIDIIDVCQYIDLDISALYTVALSICVVYSLL